MLFCKINNLEGTFSRQLYLKKLLTFPRRDPNKPEGELAFEQKLRSDPGWPKYDRNQQRFLHFGKQLMLSYALYL